jgi:hypothetical protein
MKIQKTALLQIIKEETEKVLMEQQSGYPTEEDINYLASLGADEDMSIPPEAVRQGLPYFRPGLEPSEAINLRQLGIDPSTRDTRPRYDAEYNPGPARYARGKEETYVPASSTFSQQYPYELPDSVQRSYDINDWNEREMERVARVADTHQQLSAPSGGEWIEGGEMREPLSPGLSGQQVDWDIPEYFDEETDLPAGLVMGPGQTMPAERLPETGGVFVRNTGKSGFYGTPHMKELIDSLKGIAGGGWYVGDVSLEHGGDISGHASHEAGVDADISLPTIDRDGMSTRASDRSDWGFRNIKAGQMDYDRTVEFLRKVGSRSYAVLLDPMFFPGIRAKMDELLASGDMSAAEYRRISGVNPKRGGRRVAYGWTRISNHWGGGLLKSQPDGAHKNHFHLRLRGVYPKGDPRAGGKRNKPARASASKKRQRI